MSAIRGVAENFAASILDEANVMEYVVCEDCHEVNSEGCPVDFDCFCRECPQQGKVESLISDIIRVLNSYGIY